MSDLSRMSDAELLEALGQKPAAAPDLSSMSDADLLAALGNKPSTAGFATREQRGEDKITQGEAFMTGAKQGVTFGFGDEAAALTTAGEPKLAEDGQPMTEAERQAKDLFGDSPSIGPVEKFAAGVRDVAIRQTPEAQAAYDKALIQERGAIRAAEQQFPMTTLAGNVVGGAVLPLPAAQGAKAAAAVGAGTGALYGFGTGEGVGDRLAQAATGGAIGGALGAVAGKLAGPSAPSQPNAVVQAAEELGMTVPKAIASDSMAVQRGAQIVKNVPLGGEKIVQSVANVNDDLTRAANQLSSDLGSGSPIVAGQEAATQIKDWVTGKSKQAVATAYDLVDNLVNPNVTTPLRGTAAEATKILQERAAANVKDPGGAVSFVSDAIQNPNGLTYEGVKSLRTMVREMMKNPSMLPANTSGKELQRIYTALSNDLKDAVENAGGPAALQAFNRANNLNAAVAQRRTELAKLVGGNADLPAEKVFDALLARASTSSRADATLLAKAKQAVGQDWDEVSSAIIARLGRDAEGNITPERFLTAYGKISDAGKSVLFDPQTRKALDNIATISSRMKEVGTRFSNPSGTGNAVVGGGLIAGFFAEPVTAISTVVGGNVAARILSSPATSKSAAQWARAYELAVKQPSAQAAKALTIAARNLADAAADQIGGPAAVDQAVKALSGPFRSMAEPSNGQPQQEEQRNR